MSTKQGIDYGIGKANIHPISGIRYGVISEHALSDWSADEIDTHGLDLSALEFEREFRRALRDLKTEAAAICLTKQAKQPVTMSALKQLGSWRNGLQNWIGDYKLTEMFKSHLGKMQWKDWAGLDIDEAIEDFQIWEHYQVDGRSECFYESDGLRMRTVLDSDWIITESPYYTYAQFCSPCVPGACNLESPIWDTGVNLKPAYCLPRDWFNDEVAPYLTWCCEDGLLVTTTAEKEPCSRCQGSGTLSPEIMLAHMRKFHPFTDMESMKRNSAIIAVGEDFQCFTCQGRKTFIKLNDVLGDVDPNWSPAMKIQWEPKIPAIKKQYNDHHEADTQ